MIFPICKVRDKIFLDKTLLISFLFYVRNAQYDIPNQQDVCISQCSSDVRLSELLQWKEKINEANRDIRSVSA